jgi:hypothetical protein
VGVADSGNFVFTTNLGSTGTKWTIAGTNVTTNNLFAVSCPTATQCFAVGDTGGAGNQPGTFLDGRFNTSSNTWTWQVLVAGSRDSRAVRRFLLRDQLPAGIPVPE